MELDPNIRFDLIIGLVAPLVAVLTQTAKAVPIVAERAWLKPLVAYALGIGMMFLARGLVWPLGVPAGQMVGHCILNGLVASMAATSGYDVVHGALKAT